MIQRRTHAAWLCLAVRAAVDVDVLVGVLGELRLVSALPESLTDEIRQLAVHPSTRVREAVHELIAKQQLRSCIDLSYEALLRDPPEIWSTAAYAITQNMHDLDEVGGQVHLLRFETVAFRLRHCDGAPPCAIERLLEARDALLSAGTGAKQVP